MAVATKMEKRVKHRQFNEHLKKYFLLQWRRSSGVSAVTSHRGVSGVVQDNFICFMLNDLALQPIFLRINYISLAFLHSTVAPRYISLPQTMRLFISLTRQHVMALQVFSMKAFFRTRFLTVCRLQKMSYLFITIKIIKSLEVYL